MRKLLAGIAAAALLSGAAAARPDGDHGNGKPDRHGPAMTGPAKPDRNPDKHDAGPKPGDRRVEMERKGNSAQPPVRISGQRQDEWKRAPEAREKFREPDRRDFRPVPVAPSAKREAAKFDDRYFHKQAGFSTRVVRAEPRYRLIEGCPPGLARKNNGCVPPGHARPKPSKYRYVSYRPEWWGYPGLASGNYYYDDGFLVKLDGGRVRGYVPLFGGALAIGNAWPAYYEPVVLEPYYVDYYGLGARDRYRYADDVIYRVDPESAAIVSVAALLTGDDFVVGQRIPRGYDVYNVPYGYRDRYYDRPDAYYRYSDGYVYEVDPKTMLVLAAIELLV